jgi:general secretion pathway protein F
VLFRVFAIGNSSSIQTIEVEAADLETASLAATRQGLRVVSIEPLARRVGQRLLQRPFPLVQFTRELLALLGAGMSIVEALEALAQKTAQAHDAAVINDLLKALYEGLALSTAMERHAEDFPTLYVASVRASERTSGLREALSRYLSYETQSQALRQKVISASIYPVMLVSVGLLVTLFLLGYVVPRFSTIYHDMSGDLPLMSRLLIGFGEWIAEHPLTALLAPLAGVAVLTKLFMHLRKTDWFRERLWRMPVIGEHIRIYQLARCYRTIGMLLGGGIPLPRAMDMAGGLLGPSLRSGLEQARRMVEEGRSFSEAAEAGGLVTPVAARMLRVGERAGRLGEMLESSAAFFEEEIARFMEWFTKLFEPILMAVIGIVIGSIVALLYMPIFDIAGNVK